MRLEGEGTLEVEGDGESIPVRFEFLIQERRVLHRPGFPPSPPRLSGRGWVRARDGRIFSEGNYWLTATDGQRVRVQNLAGTWFIVANP